MNAAAELPGSVAATPRRGAALSADVQRSYSYPRAQRAAVLRAEGTAFFRAHGAAVLRAFGAALGTIPC